MKVSLKTDAGLETSNAIQLLISLKVFTVSVEGMPMPKLITFQFHALNHKPLYLAGRPSLQSVQVSFH